MFKNRTFQMKIVKDKNLDNGVENTEVETLDVELIAEIVTDFTVKTVGAIGAVIAANKVLNTICELAVVTAKAKLK